MGKSAPRQLVDLVERFDQDRKVVLSPDFKEEQLRLEFLNSFLESLGWDVSNKPALSGAEGADFHRLVVHQLISAHSQVFPRVFLAGLPALPRTDIEHRSVSGLKDKVARTKAKAMAEGQSEEVQPCCWPCPLDLVLCTEAISPR